MTFDNLKLVIEILVFGLATIGVLWVTIRRVWPILKNLDDFVKDWTGEPPRPGYPGRKGMLERLHQIEITLQSIDVKTHIDLVSRVDRIERQLETIVSNTSANNIRKP